MALVNKNQPMREAEIDIADFINNRLTNMVRELAIPDENSIGLEKLDGTVKSMQTVVTDRELSFQFTADELLKVARVTVKNNQPAIENTDWKYVFNGAFASLKTKYNDYLTQNPLFLTTSIESVNIDSVTIAVVLISLRRPPTDTVIRATLTTVWNCAEVLPR